LRTLVEFAHAGSIAGAADRLFRTPSAITRQVQTLNSREALAPVFAELNKYAVTIHFVGQSTVRELSAEKATGEAYILAHHLTVEGGKRRLMIAALRYADTFAKADGAWLFSERKLYVDWIEERGL
jgi:SnoaL-like domain/Bacterial regulatory helix-turn-helix protein, lysR family